MAEIGRWNGHRFEVSSNRIRGFHSLTLKGASETEDKTASGQKYVSRKNAQPTEIGLTVHLDARLGIDVRTEALAFVSQAMAGKKDYFYIGGKKLAPCKMMLTEASVSEIELSPKGKWIRADVALTMKQASKNDSTAAKSNGSGNKSSGSGNKASVKKKNTKNKKDSLGDLVKKGVANALDLIKKAKSITATKKTAVKKTNSVKGLSVVDSGNYSVSVRM